MNGRFRRGCHVVALALGGAVLVGCPALSPERPPTTTTLPPANSGSGPTVPPLPDPPLTDRQEALLDQVVPSPACPESGPRRPPFDPAKEVEVEVARVVGTCLVHSYERVARLALAARLDALLREPDVVAASPLDFEVTPSEETTSRDQWALEVLEAPEVSKWTWPTGTGVRVAVLDGGVADHDDFEERVVEHWSTKGDHKDHGTHVAGIIGAARNNDIGTVGFAPDAEILDAPVIGVGTGSVADAVGWAVNKGADVINMSFSMGSMTAGEVEAAVGDNPDPKGPYATTVAALALAQRAGVVLVAAVGNCGDTNNPQPGCDDGDEVFVHNALVLPSAYPAALAVASTDDGDGRPSTSSQVAHVAMAAPGDRIVSLAEGRGTVELSGTSMATPHVAAAAAILLSDKAALSGIADKVERAAVVSNLLRSTAKDVGPPGRDDASGEGRLNIRAALEQAEAHREVANLAARHLTTVLVLDVSPSMEDSVPDGKGRKLDAAVEAARDIVDLARVDQSDGDTHDIGVVVFGNKAEVLVEATDKLDDVDRAMGTIDVIDSTNVGAGLELGGRQFRTDAPTRSIVLLSDGDTNTGLTQEQILSGFDDLIDDPDVVVHTVGFAAAGSISQQFLCEVAQATGGTCAQATTTIDLRRAFVASYHATSGRVVEDRTVSVPAGDSGDTVVVVDDLVIPGGVAELRLSLVPESGRLDVTLSDPNDRSTVAGESSVSGGVVNATIEGPMPGRWRVLTRRTATDDATATQAAVIVSVRDPSAGPPVGASAAGAGAAAASAGTTALVAAAAVPWGTRRRRFSLSLLLAAAVAGGVWTLV